MTQTGARSPEHEAVSASDCGTEFPEPLAAVEAEAMPARLVEAARKLQDALDERRLTQTADMLVAETRTDTPLG